MFRDGGTGCREVLDLAPSHARRHRDTNGTHAIKKQLSALLKNTDKDVFVEDYDEAPLLKRLVDDVSNGMEITRGAFVATSKQVRLLRLRERPHQ